MRMYYGKAASEGIASGNIKLVKKDEKRIEKRKINDTKREIEKFESAKEKAKSQLDQLYTRTLAGTGSSEASIFLAHKVLLDDKGFSKKVCSIILEEKINAGYAVSLIGSHYEETLANIEDRYIRERAADFGDITKRLTDILIEEEKSEVIDRGEAVIILADDMTPSEVMGLSDNVVQGIVTVRGHAGSHSSILSKSRGIVTLVETQVDLSDDLHGKQAVIDGYDGILYVEPDETVLKRLKNRLDIDAASTSMLE